MVLQAPSSESRWFVVHTRPNAETRVERRLQAQGFQAFAPKIWRQVRHARHTRLTAAPLFPCYMFVQLNLQRDRWRCINGTVDVRWLISSGETPLPLPNGLVEEFMAMPLNSPDVAPVAELKPNDPVRLTTGPFTDLVGRIQRIDAKGRVEILLNLMGRTVSVTASSAACQPA